MNVLALEFALDRLLELLDLVRVAVCVNDIDRLALGVDDGLLEQGDELVEGVASALDLLDRRLVSVLLLDQDRLDSEEIAEECSGSLDPAGLLQEVQGVDCGELVDGLSDLDELLLDLLRVKALVSELCGPDGKKALSIEEL